MAGYTKLFGSILHSSIWSEDNDTRIVWITMLAMCDREGLVAAAIPGLARAANISIEHTQVALKKFHDPDPYSRSKAFEGRRIETVDGGWRLLNHAAYREKMSFEERREYNRIKQQEHRQRKSKQVIDSQSRSALSAHTDNREQTTDTKEAGRGGLPAQALAIQTKERTPFEKAWLVWPPLRKVKQGDASRAFKEAQGKIDDETLLRKIEQYAASPQGKCEKCPEMKKWLESERWTDDPANWNDTYEDFGSKNGNGHSPASTLPTTAEIFKEEKSPERTPEEKAEIVRRNRESLEKFA